MLLRRSGLAPLSIDAETPIRSFDGQRFAGREQNRWYELDLYELDDGTFAVRAGYRTQWQGESDYDWAAAGDAPGIVRWLDDWCVPEGIGYPTGDAYADRQARLMSQLQTQWEAGVSELLDDPRFAEPASSMVDTARGLLDAEYLAELLDVGRGTDDECRQLLESGGWNGMPAPGDEGWDRYHPETPWEGLLSRGICYFRRLWPAASDTQVVVSAQVLTQLATGWAAGYPVEEEPLYQRLYSLILTIAGGVHGQPVSIMPGRLHRDARRAITRAAMVLVRELVPAVGGCP
jgi:hypothetical protein